MNPQPPRPGADAGPEPDLGTLARPPAPAELVDRIILTVPQLPQIGAPQPARPGLIERPHAGTWRRVALVAGLALCAGLAFAALRGPSPTGQSQSPTLTARADNHAAGPVVSQPDSPGAYPALAQAAPAPHSPSALREHAAAALPSASAPAERDASAGANPGAPSAPQQTQTVPAEPARPGASEAELAQRDPAADPLAGPTDWPEQADQVAPAPPSRPGPTPAPVPRMGWRAEPGQTPPDR